MSDFFKTMDLYKGIVLLSLILLPAGGWYISTIDEEIAKCEKAKQQAVNTFLEDIGKQMRDIEVVAAAQSVGGGKVITQPKTWFEGQIIDASPGLSSDAFGLSSPKESKAVGVNANDFVIDVSWDKDTKVRMDFVYAVLFNCESGATRNRRVQGQPSVWRLRSLHLTNATTARPLTRGKVPPPELEDKWTIKDMKFARREPRGQ